MQNGEIVKTAKGTGQRERDRIDHVSTMNAYSQALTSFDRGEYTGAMEKMQPVMRDTPNS